VRVTSPHQAKITLREPLPVGGFLAGLVIHGGLQAWWIEPLLRRLGDTTLFIGAGTLTAFNDNAAVTYLATLVPSLSEQMRFAVVAGAVVGGGLTVIANAPNPAGQAILGRHCHPRAPLSERPLAAQTRGGRVDSHPNDGGVFSHVIVLPPIVGCGRA